MPFSIPKLKTPSIHLSERTKFCVVLLFFTGVFVLMPQPVGAGWEDWIVNGLIKVLKTSLAFTVGSLVLILLWLLNWVALALMILSVLLLQAVAGFTLGGAIYTPLGESKENIVGPLTIGWGLIRDLANMAFVIVLMIIGIGTMLGLRIRNKEIGAGLLLPFAVSALVINFTPLFTAILIDLSHIFVKFFFDASIVGTNSIINVNPMLNQTPDLTSVTSLEAVASEIILFAIIILFNLAAFFIFATLSFLLIMRVIALQVLVIISPIAFVANILPQTKSLASQWWHQFTQWLILPIPIGLFIWLAVLMTTHGTAMCQTSSVEIITLPSFNAPSSSTDPGFADLGSNLFGGKQFCNIIVLITALAMLVLGIFAGMKTSAMGANLIINQAHRYRRRAQGFARRYAGAGVRAGAGVAGSGARWAGRKGARVTLRGASLAGRGGLGTARGAGRLGMGGGRLLGRLGRHLGGKPWAEPFVLTGQAGAAWTRDMRQRAGARTRSAGRSAGNMGRSIGRGIGRGLGSVPGSGGVATGARWAGGGVAKGGRWAGGGVAKGGRWAGGATRDYMSGQASQLLARFDPKKTWNERISPDALLRRMDVEDAAREREKFKDASLERVEHILRRKGGVSQRTRTAILTNLFAEKDPEQLEKNMDVVAQLVHEGHISLDAVKQEAERIKDDKGRGSIITRWTNQFPHHAPMLQGEKKGNETLFKFASEANIRKLTSVHESVLEDATVIKHLIQHNPRFNEKNINKTLDTLKNRDPERLKKFADAAQPVIRAYTDTLSNDDLIPPERSITPEDLYIEVLHEDGAPQFVQIESLEDVRSAVDSGNPIFAAGVKHDRSNKDGHIYKDKSHDELIKYAEEAHTFNELDRHKPEHQQPYIIERTAEHLYNEATSEGRVPLPQEDIQNTLSHSALSLSFPSPTRDPSDDLGKHLTLYYVASSDNVLHPYTAERQEALSLSKKTTLCEGKFEGNRVHLQMPVTDSGEVFAGTPRDTISVFQRLQYKSSEFRLVDSKIPNLIQVGTTIHLKIKTTSGGATVYQKYTQETQNGLLGDKSKQYAYRLVRYYSNERRRSEDSRLCWAVLPPNRDDIELVIQVPQRDRSGTKRTDWKSIEIQPYNSPK